MNLKKLVAPSAFKLGLLVTLAFCLLKLKTRDLSGFTSVEFLQNIENSLTDIMFRLRGGPDSPEERAAFQEGAHVVIAAIDERSLRMSELGMWPWPRRQVARLVQNLQKCQARVIAFDAVFSEPDFERTLPVLERIQQSWRQSGMENPAFEAALSSALDEAAGDRIFAEVLENTDNVVLGYFFFLSEEEMLGEASDSVRSLGYGTVGMVQRLPGVNTYAFMPRAAGVRANVPALTDANEAFGFFNMTSEEDRIFRRAPLIFGLGPEIADVLEPFRPAFHFLHAVRPWPATPEILPSLALQSLSLWFGQPVRLHLGVSDGLPTGSDTPEIYLGPLLGPIGPDHRRIPVERGGMFRVNYYGPGLTFRHVSAGDIIRDDPEACRAVKDKVVVVGATAMGLYDLRPNPFETNYPGAEIHASVIENVIRQDYLVRPPWMETAELAVLAGLGLALAFALSRIRLTRGLVLALFVFLLLPLANYVFLFRSGLLGHVVLPSVEMVVLFIAIAVYRYATEEREKSRIRNAFQFYLSRNVVESVLQDTSKLKLGGERRELTVLFSDIRGFTTISERLAPEALTELLNEYLTPMTDLVFRYNGTLDKYMGDAIMAIYGAPLHFPDHPRAACLTALDMMEELARLCVSWKARGLPEIDIGIGINTGPMSVGNMGSRTRFDYTVIGDNVNLGSRLEGLNKQYGTHIIVSEFTRAHLGDDFTLRELDLVIVKGKLEPVKIFELLHRGPPDPARDSWLAEYAEALAAFRGRRFEEGASRFAALSQQRPNDRLLVLYQDRCRAMQQNPPPPDWDGVFKMTTK